MASPTLNSYMDAMLSAVKLYFPKVSDDIIKDALKYSVKKRFKSTNVSINNNYTKEVKNQTLLQMCDYIADKKPIITAYGVLFERHGAVPNPLKAVIDDFLEARGIHKNQMFQYPKGSDMFEYYNLLQSLDKIDVNGRYIA